MKPPDGLNIERMPSEDPSVATYKVTVESIVHRCPIGDSGVTPCCERTPFELPRWHRMTGDDALVTCPHGPQRVAADEHTRLWADEIGAPRSGSQTQGGQSNG